MSPWFIAALAIGISYALYTLYYNDPQQHRPHQQTSNVRKETTPPWNTSGSQLRIYKGECKMCTICMEELACNKKWLLGCNHVFHEICLNTWWQTGSKTCPNCREPIL